MTGTARALCTLHVATGLFLGYAAVQLVREDGQMWAVIVFAAAAVIQVVAVLRELEHAADHRILLVRLERASRPPLPRRGITPAQEDEAALALADACCERWWTSCGVEHDETGEDGTGCATWAGDRRDPDPESAPMTDNPADIHPTDPPQEG